MIRMPGQQGLVPEWPYRNFASDEKPETPRVSRPATAGLYRTGGPSSPVSEGGRQSKMELRRSWGAPAPPLYRHGYSGTGIVEMSPSEFRSGGEREKIREILPAPAEREA